jgi:hypothetical protein
MRAEIFLALATALLSIYVLVLLTGELGYWF